MRNACKCNGLPNFEPTAERHRRAARAGAMSKEESGWMSGAKEDTKEVDGAEPKQEPRKSRRPRRANDEEDEPAERKDDGGGKGGGAKDAPDSRQKRMAFGVEDGEDDTGAAARQAAPRRLAEDEDDGEGRRGGGGGGDETEICIIPDLDEQREEDITMEVAVAPRNRARKPPPLRELDADLVGVTPSASNPHRSARGADAGKRLDLTPLACRLVPPALVAEDDSAWSFEALLQSVTQEFIADAEVDALLKAAAAATGDVVADEKAASEARRRGLAERRREASRPVAETAEPRATRAPAREPSTRRRAAPAADAAPNAAGAEPKVAEPEVKNPTQVKNSFDDDDDDDDIGPAK
ncbi:intraflagellar transport protein 43-domain-containing protein [Pelagophyceae sp. CCMP2097]|nr:intraflagellar transport protein 43-domain-containing protein [Pelagophyceae sp. CCMP2097]